MAQTEPAVGVPFERQVRPRAWMMVNPTHLPESRSLHWEPQKEWHITWEAVPLYDQAALEATADDAARVARDAEAHYWRSMVERLTAQADEWNRRCMAMLQQVADGPAMQPAPAIVVVLGPNVRGNADPTAPRTPE